MPAPKRHESNAARQAAYRKRKEEARRLEQQRKGLPALPARPTVPGERRWAAMLREATALLETILEERDAYADERSEAWRDSDKGDVFHDRTDDLRDALTALELLEGV